MKGVDAHANRLMDDRIEALAIEIVQTHYEVSDDGRKNELVNGIRISLRKLANKIDRGFNIEVRAEPLSADEDDDSDASETDTLANHIQIVMEASKALRFIKTDGEPILHLPESTDEHQETESDKQGEDRPGDEANPD